MRIHLRAVLAGIASAPLSIGNAVRAREEAWSGKRIALLQPMARGRQMSLLQLMRRNGIGHHPDADRFLGADS